ncbi:MAG: tRNA (5-methylaminomethyl-2-thiouridine)(34)-methyltransferase MnmD [Balneolaceae bacterium]|jgi:tRNA U34 5-methylaminomethyl-2-thiouridine-forming methyltransferase MnmC
MPRKENDVKNELVLTRDGSHTVYSSLFDQHYHNPNGAVAENRYVFFEQNGLLNNLRGNSNINILEIGFGTGLNLLLLLDYYVEHSCKNKINFYSVEGFPLSPDTAAHLNFREHVKHPGLISGVTEIFSDLSEGMNRFNFLKDISVHIYYGMFNDFKIDDIRADYIFHDAFSPDVNPELWTGEVFKRIKQMSAQDVMLSTYCAASRARGALAWAGWKIARAQGALGKREMTLAALDTGRLGELKRVNEERLARRYQEGDF